MCKNNKHFCGVSSRLWELARVCHLISLYMVRISRWKNTFCIKRHLFNFQSAQAFKFTLVSRLLPFPSHCITLSDCPMNLSMKILLRETHKQISNSFQWGNLRLLEPSIKKFYSNDWIVKTTLSFEVYLENFFIKKMWTEKRKLKGTADNIEVCWKIAIEYLITISLKKRLY